MVADKVHILTKSHIVKESACSWECDGSPEYRFKILTKKMRSTEIILSISKDRCRGILRRH